jgi:hypothetical protein
MKTVLILIFVLASLESLAQKYHYRDQDCDIIISVRYNVHKDSACLDLEMTNVGRLSIFTSGRLDVLWGMEKKSFVANFGDDFKTWREWEYSLRQVKPDEKIHAVAWIKNYFTDSTSISFGGGCIVVPTPKEDKVFSNRDFQDSKTFKDFGFGCYPTFRYGEYHED